MEKVVKRRGYYEAVVAPERLYNDADRMINLRIRVQQGPLYRFGQVLITGLGPALEATARRLWRPKEGDPYDYAYPYEFLGAFFREVDSRRFRKYDARERRGAGDHVMDIQLVFE